jgi:hypothetical protein
MSESQESTGPLTYEKLLSEASSYEPEDITTPAKVEILAINDNACLVRVIGRDADIESKVIDIS